MIDFHQAGGNDFTIMREHGVSPGQLKQTGRQTIAIAHGRLFNRPPGFVGPQSATDHTWERHLRFLSKAHLGVHLPHVFGRHLQRDFHGADIAGLLNDLVHRQGPMRVRVRDG